MTNTYRPVSDRARTIHGKGVLELDLTVQDETDELSGGHLEIEPRTYRVLSNNFAAAKQGEEFQAAYPVETEAALVAGGHIERVDAEPAEPDSTEGDESDELATPSVARAGRRSASNKDPSQP
jgi:hypothetical protein